MRLVMMLLVALALPLSAAVGDELTTKPSKYAVKETVDRLTTALKDKGITPAARIDHAAAAKAAGLELKPTEVLLFGNPKLGTPLMQSKPLIGIDLPMKALAFTDTPPTAKLRMLPPLAALNAKIRSIVGSDFTMVRIRISLPGNFPHSNRLSLTYFPPLNGVLRFV